MAHHWRVDAWWNHDGAAGDLLGTVLYWPLGLELADMTQDEALKLARDALEALENISTALREDDVLGSDIELMLDAITTIRETLAQPDEDAIIIQYHEATIKRLEQRIEELTAQTITEEHIAKVTSDIDLAVNKALVEEDDDIQDYKKPWVGLTQEERLEIRKRKWWDWEDAFDIDGFMQAIEKRLKEKNT
jgi:hypothetical protein